MLFGGSICLIGLTGNRPAATCFSLAIVQRNLRKRRATLLSATTTLRCGAPCGAQSSRGPRKLASLKQRAALIRLAFRSSAQPEGLGRMRNPYCSFSPWEKEEFKSSPPPVLAGPVMTQESGIRVSDCLSRRRVELDPRFPGAAQVARSKSQEPRQPSRFSFAYFSLTKQRTSESLARRDRPAPAQNRSAARCSCTPIGWIAI